MNTELFDDFENFTKISIDGALEPVIKIINRRFADLKEQLEQYKSKYEVLQNENNQLTEENNFYEKLIYDSLKEIKEEDEKEEEEELRKSNIISLDS